jgi:organic radical activating enzyme
MAYAVRDVFWTVQGEGLNVGRTAVFVRFAGCNLWNGNPEDRSKGKGDCARWCDTDFQKAKAQKLNRDQLVARIKAAGDAMMVVFTGGEPCLQLDQDLVDAVASLGYLVAVETNGTVAPMFVQRGVWVCVSPKLMSGEVPVLKIRQADELKVVLPGPGWTPSKLEEVSKLGTWGVRWVHPQDVIDPAFVEVSRLRNGDRNAEFEQNVKECLDHCRRHPEWRVGFQLHKVVNVP